MKNLLKLSGLVILYWGFLFNASLAQNGWNSNHMTGAPAQRDGVPRLVITEIMYNPPESGSDTLEFIELYNADTMSIYLEGYYFSAGISYQFLGISLNPGDYCVLSIDSVVFENVYGLPSFQYSGALNNSGEFLELRNSGGMVIDSLTYDDASPWPGEPDGNGPSLTFCNPDLDNSVAANWGISTEAAAVNTAGDTIFASPGAGCSIWPEADFTANLTVVATGGSVNFTDISTGNPAEWIWTFPGGSPGAFIGQAPPPVLYDTPGTYNVALFISNATGTSTELKSDFISVGDPPAAGFEGIPASLYAGETVDFTDLSTGDPVTWSWEFEGAEPASSGDRHPMDILYPEAGVFDVALTVTNVFGSGHLVKEDYIDVLPVGMDENATGLVYLYPNPNNGKFNLANPSALYLEVRIYNIAGEPVEYISTNREIIHFNLENLQKGVYFLRIRDKDNGQVARRKILVK